MPPPESQPAAGYAATGAVDAHSLKQTPSARSTARGLGRAPLGQARAIRRRASPSLLRPGTSIEWARSCRSLWADDVEGTYETLRARGVERAESTAPGLELSQRSPHLDIAR